MKITRLGLDLAKNVIRMHAVNARGDVVLRRPFSRVKLMTYMQNTSTAFAIPSSWRTARP
jgi:hypothetical protein